jgi:hypothetical protein
MDGFAVANPKPEGVREAPRGKISWLILLASGNRE